MGSSDDQTQTPAERFVTVLANLTGRYVTLSHRNGSKFEGVLHTFELESAAAAGVELYIASKVGKLDEPAAKPEKRRVIALADIVRIDCKYSLHEDLLGARTQVLNEVRADTEISSGSHGKERELQAWSAAAGDAGGAAVALDDWDDASRKTQFAGWDQFTVNEQKFGVTTTYDENLYTTTLNRAAVSKEAEAAAAKLAAEIEGTVATHALMAEERGQTLAGDDKYDEEARYSTVLQGADANAHQVKPAAAAPAPAAAKPAAAAAAAAAAAPAAAAAKPATASKLNPNAKAFVFNPKAPTFVPGGAAAALPMGALVPGMVPGMPLGMGPGPMAMGPGGGGFGCGYPPAMMPGYGGGAGGRGADFLNPNAPGGMAAINAMQQQMLRAGAGGFVMAGGMHGQMAMGVRGPPQFVPPVPPGAAGFAHGGGAHMGAMARGMGPPGGFAYGMPGGPPQQMGGAPPPRFIANGGGFAGPAPPRQVDGAPFEPRMG